MCTSSPVPRRRGPSTIWSKIGCRRWQGSNCIRAKPESGTERVRVLCRPRRPWRGGMESQGCDDLGHTNRFTRIRPISGCREVARGAAIVGSYQFGARSAMCLADLIAVRGASLPSLCAHPPTSPNSTEGHDRGMMETMRDLLGGLTGNEMQRFEAHRIATLPMRTRHSAYWASWTDSLQMISQRLPVVAIQVLAHLAVDQRAIGCLGELQEATDKLDREGFVSRPKQRALPDGARPPQADTSEPSEWQHGWQYHASPSSERHFQKNVVIAESSVGDQDHLTSHFGKARCCSVVQPIANANTSPRHSAC